MEISDQAPVRARRELEIGAAADVVWNVLTDIDAWPRWNADMKSAARPATPPTRSASPENEKRASASDGRHESTV